MKENRWCMRIMISRQDQLSNDQVIGTGTQLSSVGVFNPTPIMLIFPNKNKNFAFFCRTVATYV